MPATKRLVLDLPAEEVDLIERRVAEGEFESASALVSSRLEAEYAVDGDWLESDAGKRWLTKGDERSARLRSGTEPTIPMDEAFDRVEARLLDRIAQEEAETRRKRA